MAPRSVRDEAVQTSSPHHVSGLQVLTAGLLTLQFAPSTPQTYTLPATPRERGSLMRKAERERGWRVITVARWHGLPCRFALFFYASSINTQRMRPAMPIDLATAKAFSGCHWYTSRDQQQTWTPQPKHSKPRDPESSGCGFGALISMRFLLPSGCLYGSLFIHLSLLYYNYVQKPHIFVSNHKFVPYNGCLDELLEWRMRQFAWETVVICALAEWGQVSSVFLFTCEPDV